MSAQARSSLGCSGPFRADIRQPLQGGNRVSYEVFPLLCPICGGQMRIIVSQSCTAPTSGKFRVTLGLTRNPPHISSAHEPSLWQGCDAQLDDAARCKLDWDLAAQPAPDYELDQRINW